jgi:iron complex outermembrane receptor protein
MQTLTPVIINDTRINDRPTGGVGIDKRKLPAKRTSTSDTAQLLEDVPGVSTYGAGGISSLPVVRGLADDRIRTVVDGMDLMAACPNHMNPALSFIDPTKVASVEVFAGITPVSVGGDSIAGTIQVKSTPPKFATPEQGVLFSGSAGTFHRSNGGAVGYNFAGSVSGENVGLSYSESRSSSNNYKAAADFKKPGVWQKLGDKPIDAREVASSEYGGSINQDFGVALRLSPRHLVALNVSEQRLNFSGFPNQRMDMVHSFQDPGDPTGYLLNKSKPSNKNNIFNLRYTGQFEWGELETRVFRQDMKHHMDMLQSRFQNMYMPMDTDASTLGGEFKASIDLSDTDILRLGADFQNYRLDDWWPPIGVTGSSMCCNDFWNIRDGKRDRKAVFAEWEANWSSEWLTLMGVRRGQVKSSTGSAQGYNATYSLDANRFNRGDTQHTDQHLDASVLARYTHSPTQTYEAGVARKTRSPNLYERYSWSTNPMAALMNNFVGDGNAYIGNPNLKPEIARTLSLTGDWHDAEKSVWDVKLTGYVTRVDDFINAVRCPRSLAAVCSTINSTTTNKYVLLQYANHDARLFGFDFSARSELGRIEDLGSFSGDVMVSYVRGEDRTTGDDLYHIMPLNTKLALTHRLGGWSNTAEIIKVDAKDRISQVRNEAITSGYSLLNLRTSYEWKHARIDLALENALNKFYLLPLGGAYVAQGNSMTTNAIPWGMTVPGKARSLNVALNLQF